MTHNEILQKVKIFDGIIIRFHNPFSEEQFIDINCEVTMCKNFPSLKVGKEVLFKITEDEIQKIETQSELKWIFSETICHPIKYFLEYHNEHRTRNENVFVVNEKTSYIIVGYKERFLKESMKLIEEAKEKNDMDSLINHIIKLEKDKKEMSEQLLRFGLGIDDFHRNIAKTLGEKHSAK